MDKEKVLPILGCVILIFILILGVFSIKMILFPNKTYEEEEKEVQEEIEEALKNFIPMVDLEKTSLKEVLEEVDTNIKKLGEIEMNKVKTLKEELIYQKLKLDEDLQIKINLLKEKEQKQYFLNYLDILKKYSDNLSGKEITSLIDSIEKIFE